MTTIRNLLRLCAGGLALAACVAPAATEGLLNIKRLSAALAAEAVAAAVQACAHKNYYVSAVVLDYSGVRQAALRGDNAASQNMLTANDKAFTAATFETDTAVLVERSRTSSVSTSFAKVPHLVLAGGGLVIKVGDEVIGAIGVSGAPGGDNDAQCAKAGLDKIKDRMK
jgi:uncharacterized protein GlcG (DUF336 family)